MNINFETLFEKVEAEVSGEYSAASKSAVGQKVIAFVKEIKALGVSGYEAVEAALIQLGVEPPSTEEELLDPLQLEDGTPAEQPEALASDAEPADNGELDRTGITLTGAD